MEVHMIEKHLVVFVDEYGTSLGAYCDQTIESIQAVIELNYFVWAQSYKGSFFSKQ